MLPIIIVACGVFLLSAWMDASGDAPGMPGAPKLKPPRTYNPQFEEVLGVILRLVDEARDNPQLTTDWPQRRVSEIYAPASCDLPPSDFEPEARWRSLPWGTKPRTSFIADGKEIIVGSSEFEAMTSQVEPVLGFPMSCDETGCEVIVPARVFRNSFPVFVESFSQSGLLRDPRFLNDACEIQVDWCTQTRSCDSAGRESLFYRPSDRMRVEASLVNMGRARGSLKLKFVRDSDPYCDPVVILVGSNVPTFCPHDDQ